MKINTDGVLLAASVVADLPGRILDVGTGTGVISLMLAQRFPSATIDAIEIDTWAADTARRNFAASPFAARLISHAVSLADFKPDAPYDLIVSNPPFFLRSLQNNDRRKRMARHTDMDFFDELLTRSKRWLGAAGRLQIILPPTLADVIGQRAAEQYGLSVQSTMTIRSFAAHPPIRRILSLGRRVKEGVDAAEHEFVIYAHRGVYSPAYHELLKPFFLAF
ncbi:tRNA1(Val) (adenine(37)-N6)-methyltransferase [Parapedobacter sp. 10938]|uniref:tRNA1(Val) (adenine(37)-N6)-methyltransferase n=1 Tax=Parapedobacter flavus TaxID=3110225 RepID=UPI002DBA48B6|nr:methyltransferase [Parapedobacter sp. 10938]MEC3878875.1 methyltransferase [Parapedobacter sp. 10938]